VGRTQERRTTILRLTFSRASSVSRDFDRPGPYARRPESHASKRKMDLPEGHLRTMNEFVFVGLVTIAITLLAMGVMDVLAVAITTLSNFL
jgi:hypothetical protein